MDTPALRSIGTLAAKEAKEAIHKKIPCHSLNFVNETCTSVVPDLRRIVDWDNSLELRFISYYFKGRPFTIFNAEAWLSSYST